MSKRFWRWEVPIANDASTSPPTRTLRLEGTIAEESWFDDDVTPQMFREELEETTGDIVVWINSPGGDTIAAAQIYTMLMDYPGAVTVKIDGLAASAASVIAMAGTTVLMSPVSTMMIHNPATIAFGQASDLTRAISMLDEVKESIINAYEIKTGMDRKAISELMDAETWMDATKAIDLGFADDVLSRPGAQAKRSGMLYSAENTRKVLINKLASTCTPAPEPGRSVAACLDELDHMKNHF